MLGMVLGNLSLSLVLSSLPQAASVPITISLMIIIIIIINILTSSCLCCLAVSFLATSYTDIVRIA